jgi:aryl-alcohol dehydrogenase-like predicted oxidoreductase
MNIERIGLGTFPFSSVFRKITQNEIVEITDKFVDLGGSYFETAPIYARNYDLRACLLRYPREKIQIASKCVTGFSEDRKVIRSGKRSYIINQVDEELRRLGVDYLDILQTHTTPEDVDINDFLDVIDELIDKGKVKKFGVSNVNLEQLKSLNMRGTVDWVQNRLSLIHEIHYLPIVNYCLENKIKMNCYQVIERGQLMPLSSFDKPLKEDDLRSKKPEYIGDANKLVREWFKVLAKKVAAKSDLKQVHVAIAWALSQPAVEMVVLGASNPVQLQSVFNIKLPINQSIIDFIDNEVQLFRKSIISKFGISLEEFRGISS